jgi:hypothetical protein
MGFEPTVSTLGRSHVTTTPSPPEGFPEQSIPDDVPKVNQGAPDWTRTSTPKGHRPSTCRVYHSATGAGKIALVSRSTHFTV